ncbi:MULTISPECIES: hypothetical protein [unclassified Aureimonas]|uniref:hypothetical protein n=1 Tax=unclassified Aureimonas TaxID=2615206 RepID=UPI0006F43BD8|nr:MULTISPECIES: hypothetical protein [unclassified Aureimonas]KQT52915.1 hypothetical protein ASG62_13465 [Aureimonas sp. Leaf427]KQT80374.1 hypothetical protein ASG54_07315 [Aureimonas sp. Leaf460]
MKPQAILIGLVAGAAAALLFAGLILQSSTALVLSLATPIPIFIASLGWGSVAGAIAAIASGAAITALTGTSSSALILMTTMTLPAALIGHLAGLARPIEQAPRNVATSSATPSTPSLDWYPLPRILLAIAAVATTACLFVGWLVSYDTAEIGASIGEALRTQLAANGADPVTQDEIQAIALVMVKIVPFVQPALLTIILVACLHLSGLVTRASGRLPRPRDDIPTAAGLPKVAVAVFGIGILGTFLSGTVATVAAVVCGTFGAAFTLVGLASFHRRTRGRPARGLVLFAAYTAIVLLSFPLVAATILGLTETMRRPVEPAASA